MKEGVALRHSVALTEEAVRVPTPVGDDETVALFVVVGLLVPVGVVVGYVSERNVKVVLAEALTVGLVEKVSVGEKVAEILAEPEVDRLLVSDCEVPDMLPDSLVKELVALACDNV